MNEEAENLEDVGAMIRGGIGPELYPLIREQLAALLEAIGEYRRFERTGIIGDVDLHDREGRLIAAANRALQSLKENKR